MIRRLEGRLGRGRLRTQPRPGEGWLVVPITEMQIREPVRLVSQMARIIAAREARRGGSC